ncbi:hypothetical protein NMG60_11024686 [Bertholletia excelsa]
MESSSGSSKRAKTPSNTVSCLVDGCNYDLSQCREYHRRHKVCELHSKTPKVTIGGREQRFCQQCSRFHSLVEFDEGKRSCRKRLDGHNRRRRKPQSESLSRNTGRFLFNEQDSTLLSFSNPQLLPSAVMGSAWAGAFKIEDGAIPPSHQLLNYIGTHNNFPGSSAQGIGGGSQFKILHHNDLHFPDASVSQQFLYPTSASGNSIRTQKMFSEGLSLFVDSDCALSLLSSAPAETRELGLSCATPYNPIPSPQSSIHNIHYEDRSHYSSGIENKPVVTVLNSQVADLHGKGMFQNVPDESSASGSHQTLSFRWE